jgi:hypothetical protein
MSAKEVPHLCIHQCGAALSNLYAQPHDRVRWTPVIRSIERMLEPSVGAPMIAVFLSMLSTFAISKPLCLLYYEKIM